MNSPRLLSRATMAVVLLLVFCGVGLACEFPDEHSITLNSAVINGTDIAHGRTITVRPGSSLSGEIKVTAHHPGRERGTLVVAATPNWRWGEFSSNSQIYTELTPAKNRSYVYTLPAGLTAPTTPGTYYIGIFTSSVDTSQHLMSGDGISSRRSTQYFWDTENPRDPAAPDVAHWPSELWEQAVTGDSVEGFTFCRNQHCGPGYYGGAAVRVVVPEVMELEPAGDTFISSGKGFPWVGWKLKPGKYINFGNRAELSVVRGVHGHEDDFGGWRGGLIQFDLSGIPEGAEVLGAELFLYHGNRWGEPVSLHRMKQSWKEMEASWFEPCKECEPWWRGWDEEGGNYEKEATDARKVNYRGWYAWDVTKDVNLFLGDTPNHGWFLKSASSSGSDLTSTDFYSKEATDKDLVPFLRVRFSMPPPEVNFSAQPESILLNGSSTLTWKAKYAQEVKIEPKVGADNIVPFSGSVVVTPLSTATYTLTATGKGGTTTKSVTITVLQPPTVTLSFTSSSIVIGGSATLSWSTTNASSCSINGIGVAASGSMSVSPTQTTPYTITATGPGGTATASVTVTVYRIPTVSLSASPASIRSGQSSTLSWTSTNADTCSIDNGVGAVALNGTATVSPTRDTIYSITATGPGGTANAQFLVKVQLQPEGTFGQRYQDLVPLDATLQSYDPKVFALITGLVRDLGGSPIADVLAAIHGHPEYGTVRTDTSGRFSIPVEGGGTLTVVYGKAGLITSHRQVYVPWNDTAITETVVMIPEDTKSTILTFDGNAETVVTHQSSAVTDERGSRSSTLVFTGDNRAYSLDASGNVIGELSSITARATEFATPDSMPAKLPPNSAYTYCVDLSVDGAQRVRFYKPVTLWIDNFLGFKVGERVPVGYYDRDRGVWVPADNGVVVKLLATNGDGIVDALDANGDGLPDDLNGNGSFSDEVLGLGDASKYPPGSTFWRVQVTHFTPWDCNWPYGPPAGAGPPNPEGMPDADQQKKEEDDCKKNINSFVEERSRIFHEDIPIPGTNMTLHYASNRVKGYKHGITVPASGDTVPPILKRIIVQLDLAGRSLEQTLPALPNQNAEFVWDGLDQLGRSVDGLTTVHIGIGYVYDAVYYSAGNVAQAFAQAGSEVTGIRARQEVTSWRRSVLHIPAKGKGGMAEGWTLSTHHYFSPDDLSTLYKGDGMITKNALNLIETVAGSGSRCWNSSCGSGELGDGGPAVDAKLGTVEGVALDAMGNLYIADSYHGRIRRVDTRGIITTVAGGGSPADGLGDGGPALNARITAWKIAVDRTGNLYLASSFRIRKVDPSGIIRTVAGDGTDGFTTDGRSVVGAPIPRVENFTVDNLGNIYIASWVNHRVFKIDINGILTTVAGTGASGFSGDGGPATAAKLTFPEDVAVDASGNIYIADWGNYRIRKVDPSGIITTVASRQGFWSPGKDGGPALEAYVWPEALTVDAQGNLYFVNNNNTLFDWSAGTRIRKVDTSGIISTVAGTRAGFSGDGGPAVKASFYDAVGLALDPAGNLFIADLWNWRVRKVQPPSPFTGFTAAGDITIAEENGLGYILNSAGLHKKTIALDAGKAVYAFEYDENSKLLFITDRFGNNTTIQRDAGGVPTSITSPDGLTTTLTIDSNNLLTRVTYADGGSYGFEYTPEGLMTAKIAPEGNRFEHVFDSLGRLTDVIDAEGGQWKYSRSTTASGDILTTVQTAEGNLTSYLDHTDSTGASSSTITDPDGVSTFFTLTADGLTGHKSLSCGMNLDFKYDVDSQYKFQLVKEMTESTPSGLKKTALREKTYQDTNADKIPDLLTETFTVNGKASISVTDTLLSKKTVTSPAGRGQATFYDPVTLLTKRLTIPGLYETTFGYDTQGRMTSTLTNARQTTFGYDAQGNPFSTTDPEGHTTKYSYDAVGRLTEIQRPDGSSVGFTYDKNGNMTLLTNPSKVGHGFGYNRVNLSTSYQTPLSGSYSYLYDRDRRPVQTNFPSGRQIKHLYDKDRLIQTQTPEGNIDFTYLCGSKVDSVTNGVESIQYKYDGSLVTSETLNGALNQSLSYGYNNDFSVQSFTYGGGSVTYAYDNDGLLTQAGAFTIGRNAGNGLPETVTDGAWNLTRAFSGYREWDAANFAVNTLTLHSWNLTRDNAGRIISKRETVGAISSIYDYTYDSMGRLLTVTRDGTLIEEYRYGVNGTRTYEMNTLKGILGRTLSYSEEDQLLTAGDVTYQFNEDGFLTTKTSGMNITEYSYSSRGELLKVTLPDGRGVEYVHDPMGRRIAKKVNGAITEKYLWHGLNRLLAVYDGSDNLIMRFQYADDRMPAAMTKENATYYLTYDQVGSLRVIADASGNQMKRVDYDSFGSIINDTNPAFSVPFGFAGGLQDRDTGLVRFGFRDYDPDVGRWTAKDPLRFDGGDTDLYGYCVNDPVNGTDSSGLLAAPWHFGISVVAGLNSGMSLGESLRFGWDSMAVDFAPGSQGLDAAATAQHAMGGTLPDGRYQNPQEAIDAANDFIRRKKKCGDLPEAAHAAQDLATPRHAGQPWKGFGFNWKTVSHILGDLFPSPGTIIRAYQNTVGVLK